MASTVKAPIKTFEKYCSIECIHYLDASYETPGALYLTPNAADSHKPASLRKS